MKALHRVSSTDQLCRVHGLSPRRSAAQAEPLRPTSTTRPDAGYKCVALSLMRNQPISVTAYSHVSSPYIASGLYYIRAFVHS